MPNFAFFHYEFFKDVFVFDELACCVVVAFAFALLLPLFCSLLLTCWGDISFFFLGGIGGSGDKDHGEVNGEAAVEDLLDDWIHVDDPVIDCGSVFLLLAKAKPVLDVNLIGVKDFFWVSEITCDSHFDG